MPLLTRFVNKLTGTPKEPAFSMPHVLKEESKDDPRFRVWIRNHRWNKRKEAWCKAQLNKFSYRPTVGILMQCKDPRIDFLHESLASIFHQVFPFHELSIVDRGSKDPAVRSFLQKIETDPRVKVSFQRGVERDTEAIAKIMKKASAEWILLMGAEDILEPNAIYNMIATLQNTVDVDFVFSDSDLIDENGVRFGPQFKPVWAVGARYPLGYYQHPVLLHDRLVKKLRGHERISEFMDEGSLLDEASNHSRWVVQAPEILYHARSRGLKNEQPPPALANVLMNENLTVENDQVLIDTLIRSRAQPKVPLKILWATDSLERDDGPMLMYHYVRFLSSESGHKFTVVSLQDGPMRQDYEDLCPVHIVGNDPQNIAGQLSSLHQATEFEVAFVASLKNTWFPEVLAELDLPSVWQICPSDEGPHDDQMRQKFTWPATILFQNAAIQQRFGKLDTRGVARKLPAGVDSNNVKIYKQKHSPFDLRAEFGIPSSSTLFVTAGPTIARKDHQTFVRAAIALLERNNDAQLDFIIAGTRPGPELDQLTASIEAGGQSRHFHLIPEKDDPFQYYPFYLMCDVFVSCSTEEYFPLQLMEAMAMKKPVVGANVLSTNEVIENDENGYLFPAGDAQRLSESMELLLNKQDEREMFGRRSLEIIYEKFHFRKIVTRFEDLLRESIVYL